MKYYYFICNPSWIPLSSAEGDNVLTELFWTQGMWFLVSLNLVVMFLPMKGMDEVTLDQYVGVLLALYNGLDVCARCWAVDHWVKGEFHCPAENIDQELTLLMLPCCSMHANNCNTRAILEKHWVFSGLTRTKICGKKIEQHCGYKCSHLERCHIQTGAVAGEQRVWRLAQTASMYKRQLFIQESKLRLLLNKGGLKRKQTPPLFLCF